MSRWVIDSTSKQCEHAPSHKKSSKTQCSLGRENMKKALLALTVAVVGLTVGATQIWATQKAVDVTVGDGSHACKGAAFTGPNAINAAIVATTSGKTIKACSGSYNAVTVTKPMTINGTSLLLTTAQCIAPAANPAK